MIDDHGSRVPDAVWSLFEGYIGEAGPRPTLIEWDTRIPPFAALTSEAAKTDAILRHWRALDGRHGNAA